MKLEDAKMHLAAIEARRKKIFPPSKRVEEVELEMLDHDIKELKKIIGMLMRRESPNA